MSVGGLACGASGFILQPSGQLPLFGFQALAHAVPLPTTFFPRVPLPWSSQPHPPLSGLAPRPPAPFRSIGPSLTTTLCIHGLQLGPDPISSGLQPTPATSTIHPPNPSPQQTPTAVARGEPGTSLPESRSLESSLQRSLPQSLPVPAPLAPSPAPSLQGLSTLNFSISVTLGKYLPLCPMSNVSAFLLGT